MKRSMHVVSIQENGEIALDAVKCRKNTHKRKRVLKITDIVVVGFVIVLLFYLMLPMDIKQSAESLYLGSVSDDFSSYEEAILNNIDALRNDGELKVINSSLDNRLQIVGGYSGGIRPYMAGKNGNIITIIASGMDSTFGTPDDYVLKINVDTCETLCSKIDK